MCFVAFYEMCMITCLCAYGLIFDEKFFFDILESGNL